MQKYIENVNEKYSSEKIWNVLCTCEAAVLLNVKHPWWCREVCTPLRKISLQNTVNIWMLRKKACRDSHQFISVFYWSTAKGNESNNIWLMIEKKLQVKLTSAPFLIIFILSHISRCKLHIFRVGLVHRFLPFWCETHMETGHRWCV